MQLQAYISDLLYRYDCVTVPDFGAFLTNRVSAKIHETTHTFYPPKKILSFNEQLQNNDGLLANYIAEIEKIPYEAAIDRIANQVKSIQAYLSEGQTIHFENIGDLLLNNEGNISFDPSYKINYLTDAFGLSHFNSIDIDRELYKEEVEELEGAVPLTITQEAKEEQKKNRSWIKYAASAVLLLSLTGFGGLKYYNGTIEKHNLQAQEEANEKLDAKVQEATFMINNPLPAAILNVEKQSGSYHIVAGAFRIETNSDKKVRQLRAKGYKARKIGMNKYGLHEVVYQSFTNRRDAQRELYKIRRESNKEAWLLVKALD